MWNNGYRAKRIEDLFNFYINSNKKFDLEINEIIHNDCHTIPGIEFVKKILTSLRMKIKYLFFILFSLI